MSPCGLRVTVERLSARPSEINQPRSDSPAMAFFILGILLLTFCAPTTAADPCLNAPPDLVSWWQAEGNALDSAGLNNGTPTASVSFGQGKVGAGFVFDGAKPGYVSTSVTRMNVGQGDFTVEGWAKTSDTRTYNALVSFDRYNPGLYIRGNGALQLYPADASPAAGLNDGQFHHFAFVREKGIVTYYKDGTAIGTAPYNGSINPNIVYIGDDLYGGEHFNGVIDEVAFYSRALSGAEISGIRSASGGKCASAPGLALPSALPFGSVVVNSSQDATLILRNTTTNKFVVSAFSSDTAAFTLAAPALPFEIGGSSTQALTLRFKPVSPALTSGSVTLSTTDPAHPTLTVGLSGFGVVASGPGLLGEFFQIGAESSYMPNVNGRVPSFVSVFTNISFPNTTAAFESANGVKPTNAFGASFFDYFAARFTGGITVSQEGEYQFDVSSDDGAILKINGISILDRNYLTGCGLTSAKARLAAGTHPIELDYFENGGSACLDFKVSGPGTVAFTANRILPSVDAVVPAGYAVEIFADRIGFPSALTYIPRQNRHCGWGPGFQWIGQARHGQRWARKSENLISALTGRKV